MIIECINCNKKFDVNSELIPNSGRTIQCGSCGHVWFFRPNIQKITKKIQTEIFDKPVATPVNKNVERTFKQSAKKTKKKSNYISVDNNKKKYELAPYQSKPIFSLSKLLSYIIVLIISFIALIIVIDTFKSPIYKVFPDMEIFIFSFFEVLKDIELFIRDLI